MTEPDQSADGDRVVTCRSCGGGDLRPVLDLGATPIANALVDPDSPAESDPAYPLEIVFCPSCALVQLGYALPADRIFDEDYPYFSSFSDALCRHAAAHVEALIATRRPGPSSFAVEVASNDGYLLRNFVAADIRTLGIDPSPGPAAAAEAIGVPTIVGFFGVAAAQAIVSEHGRADIIVANNVMAHVPDLNDFVGGFAELLADDGLLTVENPYVRDLVEHVEFDTIYHEHYCYFSCSSVDALMARHGLHLNDVEYFPDLHGGTLRWHIGRRPDRSERCAAYLAAEEAAGMRSFDYYARFADAVHECQTQLLALLRELRAEGRTVAAYGAAAKGATLLNSTGIGTDLVAYVVDRNTHKQGKLVPGCRLPIRPVEVLLEDRPDELLLLAWNFADEIMAQQQAYADAGGTFIVPVPTPHVVASSD
jgi:SAM-dependent methyltransferase